MPGEVRVGRRLNLVEALLDEIFAEIPLPSGRGLDDLLQGLFFADGEQADAVGVTISPGRCSCQQIAD